MTSMTKHIIEKIKGSLIVSCQALDDEPLHGSEIMALMAKAAKQGGAVAIRANGKEDILAIKKEVELPIIGLVKRDYPDSPVYITATKEEVDELIEAGVSMIAVDATNRSRPNQETLQSLIKYIKPLGIPIMADVSTVEEGMKAEKLGVDCISSTLSGYTEYSPTHSGPDFELIENLVNCCSVPVIAEGRIKTPDHAKQALSIGAYAVVVGSAITRPQIITKDFAEGMKLNQRVKGEVH